MKGQKLKKVKDNHQAIYSSKTKCNFVLIIYNVKSVTCFINIAWPTNLNATRVEKITVGRTIIIIKTLFSENVPDQWSLLNVIFYQVNQLQVSNGNLTYIHFRSYPCLSLNANAHSNCNIPCGETLYLPN